MPMFTVIPYLYCDGSNFKQHDYIHLAGELTSQDVNTIKSKLDAGEYFIPYDLDLGITELQERMCSAMGSDDHPWHKLEIPAMSVTRTLPEGTETIDVSDFVAAFNAIADNNAWNEDAAVSRLGIPS